MTVRAILGMPHSSSPGSLVKSTSGNVPSALLSVAAAKACYRFAGSDIEQVVRQTVGRQRQTQRILPGIGRQAVAIDDDEVVVIRLTLVLERSDVQQIVATTR